ncbi:DUF6344 domain-containing protein [Streptomyces sp. NPDC020996]|uniref:DUF6344 domain-containing protein n=1 Tax=Streptomyces sp. NPDC020996 TaxID=3154791 RepID=UPI0033C38B74
MARNKVMTLWTAIVTAFLALCTALGLVATNAAAAVPRSEAGRNRTAPVPAPAPAVAMPSGWGRSLARALPPTMKQRIHAEAHGSSPSCRHRPLTDACTAMTPDTGTETAAATGTETGAGSGGDVETAAVSAGQAPAPAPGAPR